MATSRVFQGCRTLMAAAKTSTAGATKTTARNGIMKPIPVSPQLGSFLGASEASRADAVKKIWEYVKLHNLQNPVNKREICCDVKLKTIFDGKDKVGFLEMNKLLSQHFVKSA